jgi:hypothetical protein
MAAAVLASVPNWAEMRASLMPRSITRRETHRVSFDLKAFFAVTGKDPAGVTAADVSGFPAD